MFLLPYGGKAYSWSRDRISGRTEKVGVQCVMWSTVKGPHKRTSNHLCCRRIRTRTALDVRSINCQRPARSLRDGYVIEFSRSVSAEVGNIPRSGPIATSAWRTVALETPCDHEIMQTMCQSGGRSMGTHNWTWLASLPATHSVCSLNNH